MYLSENQSAAIARWAERVPEIRRVVLFGSYAKGTATNDSDVDLAIEMSDDSDARSSFAARFSTWETELFEITRLDVSLDLLHPVQAPHTYAFVQACYVVIFDRAQKVAGARN